MSMRGGLRGESFGGEFVMLFLDCGAESDPSDAGVAIVGKGLFLSPFRGTGGGFGFLVEKRKRHVLKSNRWDF